MKIYINLNMAAPYAPLPSSENDEYFADLVRSGEILVTKDGSITSKNGQSLIRNDPNHRKSLTVYYRSHSNQIHSISAARLVWLAFNGPTLGRNAKIEFRDGNNRNIELHNVNYSTLKGWSFLRRAVLFHSYIEQAIPVVPTV